MTHFYDKIENNDSLKIKKFAENYIDFHALSLKEYITAIKHLSTLPKDFKIILQQPLKPQELHEIYEVHVIFLEKFGLFLKIFKQDPECKEHIIKIPKFSKQAL